jgi:hypothetical protein
MLTVPRLAVRLRARERHFCPTYAYLGMPCVQGHFVRVTGSRSSQRRFAAGRGVPFDFQIKAKP